VEYISTHPVMRDYGASRAESNEVISRCPQSYSLMASCLGERPFDCAIVGPQPRAWRNQVPAFIGRREFTALLGGAAAWPLAAGAQQPERMRHIGVLMAAAADDPEYRTRMGAFQQELARLGWTEGRNARIDIRWATTNAEQIRKHSAELVALAPDVILAATGTTTVAPLLQATRTVPIVFAVVIDPVGAGFVANLAQPGGNATRRRGDGPALLGRD
jgi:hypothetical protein